VARTALGTCASHSHSVTRRSNHASKTANTPLRKMPLNVPAPPIDAIGAPRPLDSTEIQEICANQRSETSDDVRHRGCRPARDHDRDECG